MYLHKRLIESLRHALLASVVALLTGIPGWAEAAQPAPSRFEPTMEDYLGVYDALQNYRFGVEKHDQQALQSAFWPDGVNIAVPNPGQEIRMPLDGSPPQAPAGAPGPGVGPPPGANAGPPPGGGRGGEVWHLPLDSYIHFESATRASHYEYFLSIYPQPEKKPEAGTQGSLPNASSYRTSIVGWPGHYEDILEKRHGEWRILQRKTRINEK
jgi:hypothetical protein